MRARDHADGGLLGRHEGADREAAAHALGDRGHVGLHARPVVAPHLAGTAETRVDLVVEQQQAEFVADRAQVLQELHRGAADTAFALDRLDQDAGGLVVHHVAHDVGVVERRVQVAGRRRAEAFEVLLVAGGRQRIQQAAVERRLEADQLVPLGLAVHVLILADQLDAALDRLGARVAEEHGVGERVLDQPLGQLLAVADAEQVRGVPKLLALLDQSLDQVGMAVAQRVDGDAGGKVDITSAVRRVEIGTLSAFEHDVLATVRRHNSRNHS